MADEKPDVNTTDTHIVNPDDPTKAIANPEYVKPEPEAEAPKELAFAAGKAADTEDKSGTIFIGKTGNAEVDSVGTLLANKGMVNADAIIQSYSATGEVTLENKAAIMAEFGDSVGNLIINKLETVATNLRTEGDTAKSEILDYANTKFGGKDANKTWSQILDYVDSPDSGFSAQDRVAMNSMLKTGGMQARLVIDSIATVYAKDAKNTLPADLLTGDTLVQGAFEPLSAKDYATEVTQAVSKFGYDSPQVATLKNRRERSRNQS